MCVCVRVVVWVGESVVCRSAFGGGEVGCRKGGLRFRLSLGFFSCFFFNGNLIYVLSTWYILCLFYQLYFSCSFGFCIFSYMYFLHFF